MAEGPMVVIRGVSRTFGSRETAVQALQDVSFEVAAGEMVALVGRSGSGKTTLLNVVGGLGRPDTGLVHVAGTDVMALGEEGLSRLRRDTVSYIFQSFGLIPVLTAAENVGVPLRMGRTPVAERERRVAVARALAASPRLLIADEPTGQLDAETGLFASIGGAGLGVVLARVTLGLLDLRLLTGQATDPVLVTPWLVLLPVALLPLGVVAVVVVESRPGQHGRMLTPGTR